MDCIPDLFTLASFFWAEVNGTELGFRRLLFEFSLVLLFATVETTFVDEVVNEWSLVPNRKWSTLGTWTAYPLASSQVDGRFELGSSESESPPEPELLCCDSSIGKDDGWSGLNGSEERICFKFHDRIADSFMRSRSGR